jgi:hypothetical protein
VDEGLNYELNDIGDLTEEIVDRAGFHPRSLVPIPQAEMVELVPGKTAVG